MAVDICLCTLALLVRLEHQLARIVDFCRRVIRNILLREDFSDIYFAGLSRRICGISRIGFATFWASEFTGCLLEYNEGKETRSGVLLTHLQERIIIISFNGVLSVESIPVVFVEGFIISQPLLRSVIEELGLLQRQLDKQIISLDVPSLHMSSLMEADS